MLVIELKRDQVMVFNTADGLVVVRLQEDMPATKLAIQAPKAVKIYREPVELHPIPAKPVKS